ncbi:serine/threonine protein kinase, partial [bacterium]|nr:serine/threonine protein kinase [bacterium]
MSPAFLAIRRMGNDDTARDPFEELAAEFVERRRRGENPSVEEYAERYPELADEIRELFPTIGAIEGLQETELLPRGATPLGDLPFEALGDYRIVGELGRGGMGIVYEAEQVSLARHVAIKVLPRSHLLDAVHLERFRREAQLAARLHHTNIVPIFGVGEQGGYHYYVMQLIRGIGLDRAVARLAIRPGETLPSAGDLAALTRSDEDDGATAGHVAPTYWRWAARIGFCVADALAHAHGLGILHRDIKPANLLLDGQGDVWVADFGLAKAIQSDQATLTGGLTGTLRYMAPEQLRGQADARSDVYSLGITLYELLTLRPAFAQTDRSALMHEIAQGPPVALRRVEPRVPRDLETIVLKATAREPRRRYGSARELAQDLERFLEGLPVHARRITVFERGWRWCTRNPAVASLTALAALLVVAVAVVASVGYARTRRALHAEARQRRRAEASADSAVTVLDAVFESFAPGSGGAPELTVQGASGDSVTLSAPPVLSRETAALLARLLSFYERLADQEGQGSALQRKVADAHRRVADIRRRLGQRDEALAAYSRAIAITQALAADAMAPEDCARSLAELHNGLGQLHRTNYQPEPARQAHTRALTILQGAPAALSARSVYELARTHYLLGMQERTAVERPAGDPVGRRRGPMDDDRPFRDDRAPRPRDGGRAGPARRPHGPPAEAAVLVREAQHLEEAIALLEPLAAQRPADADTRRLLACCLREY